MAKKVNLTYVPLPAGTAVWIGSHKAHAVMLEVADDYSPPAVLTDYGYWFTLTPGDRKKGEGRIHLVMPEAPPVYPG